MMLTTRARQVFAATLFLGSIGLNAHTLYTALRTHEVAEPLPVILLADPVAIAAAEHDVVGTFATGERPGDRMIAIEPAGRIRFLELGVPVSAREQSTAYRLGHIGKQLSVVTPSLGIVEIVNIDTLTYFGDRYLRIQTPPVPSDPATTPAAQRRAPRVAHR